MEAFRFAGPAVVHHEVLNVTTLGAVTSKIVFNGFGCRFRTVELPQRKVRHNERRADIRGEQLILWKWIGVCRPGGRVGLLALAVWLRNKKKDVDERERIEKTWYGMQGVLLRFFGPFALVVGVVMLAINRLN